MGWGGGEGPRRDRGDPATALTKFMAVPQIGSQIPPPPLRAAAARRTPVPGMSTRGSVARWL